MSIEKIANFFKKLGSTYYNWRKRNEDLTKFLANAADNNTKLNNINSKVETLTTDMQHIKEKVGELDDQITQINDRLGILSTASKMELSDTLYGLYILYVVERGYATKAEKDEVEKIYNIYHNHLEGNGQGTKYYNDIINLPSNQQEIEKLRQGGKIA